MEIRPSTRSTLHGEKNESMEHHMNERVLNAKPQTCYAVVGSHKERERGGGGVE